MSDIYGELCVHWIYMHNKCYNFYALEIGNFTVFMISLPNLFLPKRNHFGLSVGRTSLRAVELDHARKVRALAEVAVASDVFSEGIILKSDEFVAALNKLLAVGKFSTPYVNVCFSETQAYTREYTLPLVLSAEMHEAISWHVKDLFPFPEDDIYFDWKLLESGTKEYKVSVVAVQKKVLDPLTQALISAGLKPLSFEPGASAIARLLQLKTNQFVFITEINRQVAYVTLVQGEKSLFTTVINYVAEDTSETYLKTIIQTIADIVTYYKRKGTLTSDKVNIILTGEVASAEWVISMQRCVTNEVTLLTTPVNHPAYNKAYAAALSEVAPPYDPDTINLIPTSLQRYYDTERNFRYYKALLLRTLFITCCLFLVTLGAFIAVSIHRQQLEARGKLLTAQSKLQKGNTQNVLSLNSQAKNIVTLAPLRLTPKDKIQVLQSVIPEGITITGWEYDDSKLMYSLSGVAQKREDLLIFRNKLEQTEEFTKVTLPLGSLELPLNVQFTITFVTK